MPLNVLIIEDNPMDAMLLEKALDRQGDCVCRVIVHGDRAVEFLQMLARDRRELPDLILLDLNLPGTDGVGVLNFVRNTPDLEHIPVTVVSSSPKDILARKAANADSYVTKPSSLEEFLDLGSELLSSVRRGKTLGGAG